MKNIDLAQKTAAIIPAAGMGSRMATITKKQFLTLGDKPILQWVLEAFFDTTIAGVWIVAPEEDQDLIRQIAYKTKREKAYLGEVHFVVGGKTRQESVYKGLKAIPVSLEWVVVHDGVRPFVKSSDFLDHLHLLNEYKGWTLGYEVVDTIKSIDGQRCVKETLNRSQLVGIQTPQGFRRSELLSAHEEAAKESFLGTDDASLLERQGERIKVVQGRRVNIKVTEPMDLAYAEWLMKEKS